MSIWTPPTLLRLAGRSLLRDQASAIAALEYLPAELFPPLFIQAYHRRKRKPLKAMVHAWPFTVLPLGCLSQLSLDKVLKAVLDGLDVLIAQEVRPRRWKLRVLDLRNSGANFWRMWCGDSTQNCSPTEPVAVHSSSPNMEHPLAPLEVFLDLNFNERDRDKFFMYIIRWAQQREGLLHLCCKALRISEVPFQRVRKVLDGVQLDCIQEVKVKCTWDLPTLGTFALYLGQMSNLQRLSLSHIHMLTEEEEEEEEIAEEEGEEQEWEEQEEDWDRKHQEEQGSFSQFLSQMLRLRHVRDPNMDSPSFLRGRLDQMLRCLQTPLDKLSVTNCHRLTHSDLTHLFQCPNLMQLKSLHLFGLSLSDFSLEPLRALLEAVAPTLEDLGLDNCGMVDSQVEAILPVLSRCQQLRVFTISENSFSVATVEKLLRHTAGLRSLELELYPVPLECYRIQGTVNKERLALIRAELMGILRELGQPRTICLGKCGKSKVYDVEFS
ncbi:PRAME family member 20/21 [Myotis brandtii]|uniref:PRAME family member 20/21 n=2 Tax=Myotis brandtii TaxID=109478 RepID=S7MTX2_MYOBR|nr:PRAME family member 20/21 [Myotis brandtii]